jgi:hypothetical protein
MYELADPTAEADLAADAARGVDVRVLFDQHLEKSANTGAYDYLSAHRVHVRWAPAGTTYHQKTLTVDGATSVIMTAARLARQAILGRTGAPQLWCILDEGVLHRAIGGSKVMRSQLYPLAEDRAGRA